MLLTSSCLFAQNGKLLYKGKYTLRLSQSRELNSGYFVGDGSFDNTEIISIYEDQIKINFNTCKYETTNSNGERVYKGGSISNVTVYVSPSYELRYYDESFFNGRSMRVTFPITKGESLMPESSGGYGGGKSSGYQPSGKNSGSKGTNSSSHQVKKPHADYKDCHICHGSGVCSTCGGKGWYNNPYGTGRVECSNCSKTGKCRTCNGTGKVLGPTKWD